MLDLHQQQEEDYLSSSSQGRSTVLGLVCSCLLRQLSTDKKDYMIPRYSIIMDLHNLD